MIASSKLYSPHSALNSFFDELERIDKDGKVLYVWWDKVSLGRSGRLSFLYRPILGSLHLICLLLINLRKKRLYLREYSEIYFLFFLLFPFLYKNLYIFNSHNIQFSTFSRVRRIFNGLLSHFGVKFVAFDCVSCKDEIYQATRLKNLISVPHPADNKNDSKIISKFKKEDYTVGILLTDREDQDSQKMYKALNCFKQEPGFRLLVGSKKSCGAEVHNIVSTSSSSEYYHFLRQLDFLLLPYKSNFYKYRVSGVLSDALSQRVIPVFPELPCLIEQATYSGKLLGISYNEELLKSNNVNELLMKIESFRWPEEEDFSGYIHGRMSKKLAFDFIKLINKYS